MYSARLSPTFPRMKKLTTGLFLVLLCTFTAKANPASRVLSFYHTHTGQSLKVVYWVNGEYQAAAIGEIRNFLGDWRNGARIEIDPKLLDALFTIQIAAGSSGTYEVISAYRSPATNEMLRSRSNGVARKSQHVLGKAIDVRLTDLDTKALQLTALELKLGGVGYYAKSDFVHIDTGRVRRW